MNNVNRLIFVVLIFVGFEFCHAENAKLTAELTNSGFHRFVNSYYIDFCGIFPVANNFYYSFQRRTLCRRISRLSGQTTYIPYQTIVTSECLC